MLIVLLLAQFKITYMTHNINIEGIVTMMKQLPTKYDTPVIEIARGRFKKSTTLKERIKRFTKWLMKK
jgi:hypothetical protein